jgi:excisionase family DNA binding protein
MIENPTTSMLTVDDVARRLKVGQSSVEEWIKNLDLGSFKKGSRRRVSEQCLTEFVLVNTLKPRRPDWLTREIEEQFWRKIDERVQQAMAGARHGNTITMEKAA